MRLHLWPRDARGEAPAAAIALDAPGPRLVEGGDAALAAAVAALATEPALPLAVRTPLPGGGRAVGLRQVAPGDPDYPRAFADALARRTGLVVAEAGPA